MLNGEKLKRYEEVTFILAENDDSIVRSTGQNNL